MSLRVKLYWISLLTWKYRLYVLIRFVLSIFWDSLVLIIFSWVSLFFLSFSPVSLSMEWVLTTTQKIKKNQAKHWISHRSFIVPYNYKGKLIFSFGQSVSYRNTDKLSCFDNYIDFQCILFRQAFQTGLSTFLLLLG